MQFHPKDLSELDELTEEHLGFSALSEGLGFTKQAKRAPQKPAESYDAPAKAPRTADQRWSSVDAGRGPEPWAPKSEAATSRAIDADPELQRRAFSGMGAVAAGPARPVPQRAIPGAMPQRAMPTMAPQRSMPLAAPRAPAAAAAFAGSTVLAEPAAHPALRLAATAVDAAIVLGPVATAWWLCFHEQSWAIFNQDRRAPLALLGFIFAVYFLLSESFGGQSLGKMVFQLRVVEDDKYQKPIGLPHAAKRLFLFVVGTSLGGLGLLAPLWDPKRRPWHDRYSGTIVRRKA